MRPDFWRLGQWSIVATVAGSFVWTAPSVIRHGFGIVVLEQAAAAAPGQSNDVIPALDLSAVLALAPFGRAVVSELPDRGSASAAIPELSLKGIFSATQADTSVALISVSDTQDFYRAGDPLSETLVIETVAADHVVVRSDSARLTLRFDAATEQSEAPPDSAIGAVDINDRLRAAAIAAEQIARPGPPETTADYIAYWRRKIRKNPQEVLNKIGLEPTGDGYRIAQSHNRGVRLAGLQAGDLVRSINGKALGNPDEDRLAYDAIAASGQARLEVQRGDKVLTFSFPLR